MHFQGVNKKQIHVAKKMAKYLQYCTEGPDIENVLAPTAQTTRPILTKFH